MTAITFNSLDYSGTPDEEDIRAAKLIVAIENESRAAQDPPLDPLPDTGAGLKTSYLGILLAKNCQTAHDDYIRQANAKSIETDNVRARWNAATEAQRAAALAELPPLP